MGQALFVALVLLLGFFMLPDRFTLVVLVAAMGFAAFLLNRLLQWVLRWAARPDDDKP
jgi:predicted lysophospholipase L1 biosynthesis ABC-type transport system permease subunit